MDGTQDQNTAPSLNLGGPTPAPVPGAALIPPQPRTPLSVPVPGQTDTQRTVAPLAIGAPTKVHMRFDDGTEGDVPQHRVTDAIKDGGRITTHIFFDDGTDGWVPLDKVHDALKDGGTLGYKPQRQGVQAPDNVTMVRGSDGKMYPVPNDWLQKTADAASGILVGAGKGAAETAHTAGRLINLATGDRIPGLPTSFAQPPILASTGTAESVGKGLEGIGEFFAGDEALKGLSIADRMGLGARVAKLAESHPVVAGIIDAGLRAIRTGTVSGLQTGAHIPTLPAVATGAAFGAGGELAAAGAGGLASKLAPRTIAEARQAAQTAEATAQTGRQATAAQLSNIARNAVSDITETAAGKADSFKDAADQIKTHFNPTFDKIREAAGAVRNPSTGRYSINAFDDAANQIARAKKVIFSPSPASTDAIRQAETELAEGEAKLNKLFDSSNVDQQELQAARTAWSKASTIEDLHGYLDKAFSQPAGVRKVAPAAAEVNPARFVKQANSAIDALNENGKLEAALGRQNFQDLLTVRQGVSDAVSTAAKQQALTKAARQYLAQQGASVAGKTGAVAMGGTLGLLAHVLGASGPVSGGLGTTVALAHFMYTHPDDAVRILRLTQKAAPVAAQAGKQVVTHLFNEDTGELEPVEDNR